MIKSVHDHKQGGMLQENDLINYIKFWEGWERKSFGLGNQCHHTIRRLPITLSEFEDKYNHFN